MDSNFRNGRRQVLLTIGMLIWASAAAMSSATAAVKTIEAKTGPNVWAPAAVTAAVGDVIEWKLGAGTHGVRITNWAAVKDHVEVEMVAGQEPFDATTGQNPNSTNTAGKVLLRLKVKTVPPSPAEITYNCIVHGAGMAGKVTVTANAVPNSTNRIPNVRMKTQDNKDVLFYDDLIKNKVVVINLMYTNCETCEKGTKNLVQLQKALGDHLGRDVFIYSISLDPQTDTPEVLKGYATKYGAKPGWTFLTGKDEDVDAIRQSLGLTMLSQELRAKIGLPERKLNQDADQKLHTGMIAIGNDTFKRWSKTSALSRPDQILQIIERMKPPSQPKK